MIALLRWLAIASVFLIACGVANADDKATRIAQKHFEKAQKLYNVGKFQQALDEYEAAYDAKPLGDFLFNIAQCYRNLEDYDRAIFSFKKYLKEKPDADDRDQVEKFISELEDKRDRGEGQKFVKKDEPVEPPPPPPPHHDDPFYKKWWFWTGVLVIGAGAGVGIYEVTKNPGPPSTDLGNIGRVWTF